MKKHYFLILACIISLVMGAGYGKSNVMEKQIGIPSTDTTVKDSSNTKEQTTEVSSCENISFHPFTIHLEMNMYKDSALSAAETYTNSIGQTFITRTPVSDSIWYSVDFGSFKTAKEAVAKMQEMKAKGIIPKDAYVGVPVPYAVEIIAVDSREKAVKTMSQAKKAGTSAYIVQERDSCYRVLSGAFPNKEAASALVKEISNHGLSARVAPR